MRCDRCPATARTWWAHIPPDPAPSTDPDPDTPELYLCHHHGNTHGEAMVEQGWALIADDRDTLTAEAVG